jgi:hypothetical protein
MSSSRFGNLSGVNGKRGKHDPVQAMQRTAHTKPESLVFNRMFVEVAKRSAEHQANAGKS